MKRYYFIILSALVALSAISCAPVIRRDLMDAAIRNIPLSEVKQHPESYVGKLFVLGGIIADTRVTAEGSLIEALYVTVDSQGYLKDVTPDGRFQALFPKESGLLDPMIFRKERAITLAGEFVGTRKGKIGEMEYVYPFFKIKEIHLWQERREYYMYSSYYYPYPYMYWGGYPWWWDRPYYGPPYWW
jgi:outer membrane lipoprotein